MSEMVERVAMATCSSKPCICKHLTGFVGMDECLHRGRKGIAAMEKPTEAMLTVGRALSPGEALITGNEYRAMVLEALK